MVKRKPRILLCWGYYRKGWIEVFEKLNDDFEFHYLFWLTKEDELEIYTECPRHYWEDFKSGQDILRKIQPDKVVFMDVNNLVTLSLQFACKRKSINTYVLQHGLFHDLKTNLYLDEQMAKNKITISNYDTTKRKYKWRFLQLFLILRSITFRELPYLFKLISWQWDERKMLHLKALSRHKYSFRQCDHYIVYTKFNGQYFKEINGISEEKMLPVGVPEFDNFFNHPDIHSARNRSSDYNLLIDSALTYNEVFKTNGIVDQKSYNEFLCRINQVSLLNGKRLLVKLHPFSYQNANFLQHENIEYIKDADMVKLIMNADHIFGFDSTLMLIAMYLKPTILFSIHDFGYLQLSAKKISAAPVLKFDEFTIDELQQAMLFKASDKAIQDLIDRFLYATDGKSYTRIASILAN